MKKSHNYGLMYDIGLLKMIKVMRIAIFILFISLSQTFAVNSYSQQTKLTFNLRDVTVEKVLDEVETSSEFFFLYNRKMIDVDRKVDLTVSGKKVDEVLDELFNNTDVSYTIKDRQILLINNSLMGEGKRSIVQQVESVSGTVQNSSGESIPGVTVVVKGTTQGTICDSDGKYSLTNVPADATLIFSFVGMKTTEVPVDGKTIINVELSEETIGLGEVIAIGYGTMKKSDLTGSVTSVSSEELAAFPTLGVSQAIQGRAAGIQITQLNGEPGSGTRIRIRGGTSINASSEPLWVVDGFAGGIAPPPEDIESIEILKDASSTAIYGSRGANGVILVTTKSGKKGETRIEFNSSYSFDKTSKKLDVLNASEFATYINEVRTNNGAPSVPFSSPGSLGEGTDWQDIVFRDGSLQNYQLSASGGKDNFRFYTSVNYFDQEGIIINSDYKRYSGLMNLDFEAGKNLKIGTKMHLRRQIHNGVRTQGLWGGYEGVTTYALTFEPTTGIYNEDGTFSENLIGDPSDNPYAIATQFADESVNDMVEASGYVDLTLAEGLILKSTFGVNIRNNRNGSYWPTTVRSGREVGGRAGVSGTKATSVSNENYLTYNKTFNDIHKINVVGGMSYLSSRYESWNGSTESYITDNFLFWNLEAGADYRVNYSDLNEWTILSYFGRANYNFKDKYLVTFTGRYDGSSRFGANNKWGFFPSGAFAWNVKQEPFLQSVEDLSHLKFRVSYGVVGNTDIGTYRSLANFSSTTAVVDEGLVNAVLPSSVANADLSWESTQQTDIGIDMGLWNERVILTADYYYKKTDDLLYDVPLPEYSGYYSMLKNIGAVENKGFEFGISTVNVQGKFNWTTDLNVSMNRNKILSLPGGEVKYAAISGTFNMESTSILTEGSPVGSFYGYIFDGVDAADGSPMFKDIAGRDAEGNLVMEADGVLNSDDRKIIGNPHPDFIVGVTNTIRYKNFDLNVFFQGVVGGDIYNFTRMELEVVNGMANQLTTVLDRWTPSNTDASIPRASNANDYTSSTRWIEDATYIRLKNLSIGYNLPASLLSKTGIEKVRVYVSGQNLLTITDYSGYNPDISYRDGNIRLGLDYDAYPTTRSITLGLNLSF